MQARVKRLKVRKRMESVHKQINCGFGGSLGGKGERTEDEFLRRREHVKCKCNFVLIILLLQPLHERCWLE